MKARAAKGESEASIQRKTEDYLDYVGLRYIRLPDNLYMTVKTSHQPSYVKARIMQNIRGVPDLVVLKKDGDFNQTLLLELKKKGGRLSQGQKNWHKGLNVAVVYGFEEAKEIIDSFNS
ncbi:MAG: VRR-NUC domain-containing protein [bacterium]|nr:VRR-NUC domain-containing protein [bacterium]